MRIFISHPNAERALTFVETVERELEDRPLSSSRIPSRRTMISTGANFNRYRQTICERLPARAGMPVYRSAFCLQEYRDGTPQVERYKALQQDLSAQFE